MRKRISSPEKGVSRHAHSPVRGAMQARNQRKSQSKAEPAQENGQREKAPVLYRAKCGKPRTAASFPGRVGDGPEPQMARGQEMGRNRIEWHGDRGTEGIATDTGATPSNGVVERETGLASHWRRGIGSGHVGIRTGIKRRLCRCRQTVKAPQIVEQDWTTCERADRCASAGAECGV